MFFDSHLSANDTAYNEEKMYSQIVYCFWGYCEWEKIHDLFLSVFGGGL